MLIQENTGLVIIDVQGKLAQIIYESDQLILNLEKLIKGCQILSIPIIWLEQNPKGLGSTIPELQKLLSDIKPIEKYSFNAFDNENFQQAILESKKTQWLLCGIETHICVYQTALGILSQHFEAEVVTDCVSSRSNNNKEMALRKLEQKGVGLTTVEMCLYELMKSSKNENFKEILNLIR